MFLSLVFSQFLVNFSEFQSVLVNFSFNQVTQDKNAEIFYRQEGGAKQHPMN